MVRHASLCAVTFVHPDPSDGTNEGKSEQIWSFADALVFIELCCDTEEHYSTFRLLWGRRPTTDDDLAPAAPVQLLT